MTEQPRDLERPGDVGQAYARLWKAVADYHRADLFERSGGGALLNRLTVVSVDDLELVLQTPVAHATTPEALRRAVEAAHLARGSQFDPRPTDAMIRAAIVAALGVPEPVEADPEPAAEQDALL